ncbi:uncharacterized protein LOC132192883 [Neocloeon triangulifer]|uniref:uncharacterized protein LOC132192883 n=1 Tax=Neocloeon triangulifer TaxID=2078957 RepID=UPI00286ECF01|nr:uncharacterized protein LOC132192883 [Neocloeon triangulifer]
MTLLRTLMALAGLFLAAVAAAPTQQNQLVNMIYCFNEQGDEFWPCVKQRALTLMDKALTVDRVSLMDGLVTLERDPRQVHPTTFQEDDSNLPKSPEARNDQLDQLLMSRTSALLESTSLRIKLPSQQTFEGRVKKFKKLAAPLIIVLAMVALAAVAMKAVVVSKVALAIVSWIFIKNFLNGGEKKEKFEIIAKHPESHDTHSYHHESTNHVPIVVKDQAHQGGLYGRYFDAQNLAYQAQKPADDKIRA